MNGTYMRDRYNLNLNQSGITITRYRVVIKTNSNKSNGFLIVETSSPKKEILLYKGDSLDKISNKPFKKFEPTRDGWFAASKLVRSILNKGN